jgi:hypothetical protein
MSSVSPNRYTAFLPVRINISLAGLGKKMTVLARTSSSFLDRQVNPAGKSNTTLIVGFEALTPVVMKSSVFWDITPCSPL